MLFVPPDWSSSSVLLLNSLFAELGPAQSSLLSPQLSWLLPQAQEEASHLLNHSE